MGVMKAAPRIPTTEALVPRRAAPNVARAAQVLPEGQGAPDQKEGRQEDRAQGQGRPAYAIWFGPKGSSEVG